MMKVLQMLLKTPGGKKAAGALWRSMNKGKGLARSTKGGRPKSPFIPGPNEKIFIKNKISKINRHPGDPKGVKVKDTVPGVRAQSMKDRAIRMDLRGMSRKLQADNPFVHSQRGMMKAKPLPGNVIRGVDRFRRPVDARRAPQPPQSQMGAKNHLRELEELYNKIAKIALPAQKATRRKPRSLYGKTKKAMRPAYNKMMQLRKRLQEKGLV
jgi:hypothetical protein